MTWVLTGADARTPTEAMILMVMADRCDPGGTGCYYALATIAEQARVSVSTVQRTLRELESRGVITRGDQRPVAHLPARHRPVVWDLAVGATGQIDLSDPGVDRSNEPIRPVKQAVSDRSPVTDNPRTRSKDEPNLPSPDGDEPQLVLVEAGPGPVSLEVGFDTWWRAYPRKQGKRVALKAYARALRRADALTILAGAQRYAADPNRREQFTAHPSTWLNRDGWDDAPEPARSGRDRGVDANVAEGFALARRLADEDVTRAALLPRESMR